MKNFLFLFLFFFSFSLFAQEGGKKKELSKHEIGLQSQFLRNPLLPTISYNYYRKEGRILHFRPLIVLGGFPIQRRSLNVNYQSIGLDFWSEKRNYFRPSGQWFWSRGLTANLGYSNYDYTSINLPEYVGSAVVAGVGYRLGLGYKISQKLNLMTSINPRWNWQFISSPGDMTKRVRFQAPLLLALYFRF